MTKVLSRFNKSWLRWSLHTSVGSGLGFFIVFVLSLDPDRNFSHYLAELAIIGLFTSLGQWIILRTHLRYAWLWIPATMLGLALGQDAVIVPIYAIYALIFPISVGLFVGVFQSLVMRRSIKDSLVWIIVSTLGWGLAYRIVVPEFYMKLSNFFFEFFSGAPAGDLFFGFFLGVLIGLMIGAITGLFIGIILTEARRMDSLIPQGEAS